MVHGTHLMQNAFLNKVAPQDQGSEGLQLAQIPGAPEPTEIVDGVNEKLLDMYHTKFMVMGSEWNVWDWTVFIIILAVVIVGALIGFLFCCCMSGNKEQEEKAAADKVEKDKMEMD